MRPDSDKSFFCVSLDIDMREGSQAEWVGLCKHVKDLLEVYVSYSLNS